MRQVRGSCFVPCRRRLCTSAWCRWAWAKGHARTIAGAVQGDPARSAFLTITPRGEWSDESNRSTPERFARLMVALRQFAPDAEYARVLELQDRGALHVHAVLVGWDYVPHAVVLRLARLYGFGGARIERVRSADGVGGYIASAYLLKSHRSLGARYRVVQYSRGFPRLHEDPMDVAERHMVNVVDPPLDAPAIRQGETWVAWAERMSDRGYRGPVWSTPPDALAYVRPPRGSPPATLFELADV